MVGDLVVMAYQNSIMIYMCPKMRERAVPTISSKNNKKTRIEIS